MQGFIRNDAPIKVKNYLPYELLQIYRSRGGLTQSRVAEAIGLRSKRMIQYWEAGTALPKAENLRKLIAFWVKSEIFLPGQFREEAHQFWNSVKEAHDTRLDTLTPYPLFDDAWFEILLDEGTIEIKKQNPNGAHSAKAAGSKKHSHNLPVQFTSFIGRTQEIYEIQMLLQNNRLLTLTGSGGTGKTRLSIETAFSLLGEYEDGVWFIDLSGVEKEEDLIASIASTLKVFETPGRSTLVNLDEFLEIKTCLLVLDNFEQIVNAAPQLVKLLKAAPELKLLVTSRISLQLTGEQEYPVQPLSIPFATREINQQVDLYKYPSIQLFVERAKNLKPHFTLTSENYSSISEICRRLDGLPLAIELAAARIKTLSPGQILERLNLSLLGEGNRDKAYHKQTIHQTIEWSYNLLPADEQDFFGRLSVFNGFWTLEAAEEVCSGNGIEKNHVLELLTELVNNSLIVTDEFDSVVRFRFLQLIREYAQEKLFISGLSETYRQTHARYYLKLVEAVNTQTGTALPNSGFNWFEQEYDNLRVALDWAILKEDTALALRFGSQLGRFWQVRGYWSEGRNYFGRLLVLALPIHEKDELVTKRAECLNRYSRLVYLQGNYRQAFKLAETSLELFRQAEDASGISKALQSLAVLTIGQGELPIAQLYLEELLPLLRAQKNNRGLSLCLNQFGTVAWLSGDFRGSTDYQTESLGLAQQTGDKSRIALALGGLALVNWTQGNYETSQQYAEESLRLEKEIDNKRGIVDASIRLGLPLLARKEYKAAKGYFTESLNLANELGDKTWKAYALICLGWVAAEEVEYTYAWQYLEEGLTLGRETSDKFAIVQALTILVQLSLSQNNYLFARAHLVEAINVSRKAGYKFFIALCLAGAIEIFNRRAATPEEKAQKAVRHSNLLQVARLVGKLAAILDEMGMVLTPSYLAYYKKGLATKDELGEDAFLTAFVEGNELNLEEAIRFTLDVVGA